MRTAESSALLSLLLLLLLQAVYVAAEWTQCSRRYITVRLTATTFTDRVNSRRKSARDKHTVGCCTSGTRTRTADTVH